MVVSYPTGVRNIAGAYRYSWPETASKTSIINEIDALSFNHGCLDAPDIMPAGSVHWKGPFLGPRLTELQRPGAEIRHADAFGFRLVHDAARIVGTSDRLSARPGLPRARCSKDDSGRTCSGVVRLIDGREGWRNRYCESHWPWAYAGGADL